MPSPVTGTFSLATIDDLTPIIADRPLGDISLNLALASGRVTAPAHVGGALPVEFTFHVGGDVSVQALNGTSGPDEAGVVAAEDAATPAGRFAPLLRFDKANGWLKYVATAGVKADVGASGGMVSFVGGAGAQLATADYHRHALADGLRAIVPADLLGLRSAMVLAHVQNLPEGDALAFQTTGRLTVSLDIEWSDVFTSEIGRLARLLPAAAPIAIKTKVGASCSVKVSVDDGFVVAFARRGGTLVVGVRKSAARKIDAAAGATIAAALADPAALESVLDEVVAGLLADAGGIGHAADALKATAKEQIRAIVESKVEAAFAYEYHRISRDASVFEAEIRGVLSSALHGQLVGGDLAAATDRPPTEIAVRKFLNDTSTTVARAWGFTLGLNKWTLFGRDRRDAALVEHVDRVAKTISRSYIGSGGYERTDLSWTVDFAADMAHASLAPIVGDYVFGLHLAVVRDRQPFKPHDLDEALDFAVLWNICPEDAAPFVRRQLAVALNRPAEWSFHLRVNDEALRPMCRVLGSMAPRDFAGAAAAALAESPIASVARRRALYEPLWQTVLAAPDRCNAETVRLSADTLLHDAALAGRERLASVAVAGFDLATVAGTLRANDTWYADCASLSRGCRLLADALALPTRDTGNVADAYRKMVAFWTQSHYVRTLGAALVDCARAVGQFKGVERTLNLTSGAASIVIGSNQF